MVAAKRAHSIQPGGVDLDIGEFRIRRRLLVQRRVQRRVGKCSMERENDLLGPSSLGYVVVSDGQGDGCCHPSIVCRSGLAHRRNKGRELT